MFGWKSKTDLLATRHLVFYWPWEDSLNWNAVLFIRVLSFFFNNFFSNGLLTLLSFSRYLLDAYPIGWTSILMSGRFLSFGIDSTLRWIHQVNRSFPDCLALLLPEVLPEALSEFVCFASLSILDCNIDFQLQVLFKVY